MIRVLVFAVVAVFEVRLLLAISLASLIGCSQLGKRAESPPFPDAFSLRTYEDPCSGFRCNGAASSFKSALDWYTHVRFETGAMFHILAVETVTVEQLLQLRHRLQSNV